LYGATYLTGTSGAGAIYCMATNGTGFTVLATLSLATNGVNQSSLLEAADGKLYGSACGSGSLGYGSIFKLNKAGTDFVLARRFGPASINGLYPKSALMQVADGTIYGSTTGGGAGWGTVFVFPGLPPLVGNQQQALVLSSGGSASLGVTATQWPMGYQWFLNGVAVAQATNACLPLNPVSLALAGNYQVIISNSVGSVTSFVASVTAFESNWATNQFRFNIGGPVGAGYRIDFRDDLTSGWGELTNFSLVSSPVQIGDADSASIPQRFYRLVKLP
jgi:hypothetical protein